MPFSWKVRLAHRHVLHNGPQDEQVIAFCLLQRVSHILADRAHIDLVACQACPACEDAQRLHSYEDVFGSVQIWTCRQVKKLSPGLASAFTSTEREGVHACHRLQASRPSLLARQTLLRQQA